MIIDDCVDGSIGSWKNNAPEHVDWHGPHFRAGTVEMMFLFNIRFTLFFVRCAFFVDALKILFNDAPRPKKFIALCAVIPQVSCFQPSFTFPPDHTPSEYCFDRNPQEDTLYCALTPRETFNYVARLRLGDSISMEEKKAVAEVPQSDTKLVHLSGDIVSPCCLFGSRGGT